MDGRVLVWCIGLAALGACGPPYPRGKTVRTQPETVLHYPEPELPNTEATLAALETSGLKLGCSGGVNDDALSLTCEKITYVFGGNPKNPAVLVASCLGAISDADCERTLRQLIAGTK